MNLSDFRALESYFISIIGPKNTKNVYLCIEELTRSLDMELGQKIRICRINVVLFQIPIVC